MKHHIIFITIVSLSYASIHNMEKIPACENRSLRDELLFTHTIKQQFNVPKDISNLILYASYALRDINQLRFKYGKLDTTLPKQDLNFKLLSKNAFADFLYLTNKEEITFLKMEPFIMQRESIWCINIVKTKENNNNYFLLPQKIQDHPWWLIKEYDD